MNRSYARLVLVLALTAFMLAVGCGGDDDADANNNAGLNNGTPGGFGEVTSTVVIVNPVVNAGSSTTVEMGSQRADVEFTVGDLDAVSTDATGLAVVRDIPTGTVPFEFEPGTVEVDVQQEKELYDVVVAVREDGVEHVFAPVRYPIGGEVIFLEEGGDIEQAAEEDNAIIVLEEGVYPGPVEIRAEGVLIFGSWSADDGPRSTIEGDVTLFGGDGRIRGVDIAGKVTSSANGFSLAFSQVDSADITGNGVTLLRNNFTGNDLTVPSSNSVLVDNEGID
ncbi:MAG: hypothetical protein ACOC9J_01960 [Persicimonas sp.]